VAPGITERLVAQLATRGWKRKAQQKELELELMQSHMAQKPVLRGEVGARVRVIRACGQRQKAHAHFTLKSVTLVSFLSARGGR